MAKRRREWYKAAMPTAAISRDILRILRCPQTHTPLHLVPSDTVAALNARIRDRQVRNQAGDVLERELRGALVNADQSLAYPIYEHGPTLIVEESLRIAELALPGPWQVVTAATTATSSTASSPSSPSASSS